MEDRKRIPDRFLYDSGKEGRGQGKANVNSECGMRNAELKAKGAYECEIRNVELKVKGAWECGFWNAPQLNPLR